MELHFDFTQDATRAAILGQLQQAAAAAGIELACPAADQVPDRHHHDLPEILATIDCLTLASPRVRDDMRGVYGILASAEAQVHGLPVERTHFHEVGRAKGIRNVAAICTAFDLLAPDAVTATPVQVGSGQVECAHGLMDVPAPATEAILQAHAVPRWPERLEGERCTPTSAAVIAWFVQRFDA